MPGGFGRFRIKLLLAMLLLVTVATGLGLFLAQRNLALAAEREMRREFQGELETLRGVQELRHSALAELCRVLVRKPRIHAALEDNALDLLYPIARDELRDVVRASDPLSPRSPLQADFYRFLDQTGAVIPPDGGREAGLLTPVESARLTLPGLTREHQVGYLVRRTPTGDEEVAEVIAMPILSQETDEVIAALVLGFSTAAPASDPPRELGTRSGFWLDGRLHLPSLAPTVVAGLGDQVSRAIRAGVEVGNSVRVRIADVPHLLFYKQINPGSRLAPAYEVTVFPLTDLLARQQALQWRGVGAGLLILLGGLAASHFIAARLSVPVEKLAADSEENRAQRERVEAALELSNEGMLRAARFSSDASHQLKTPVTVLRSGLEELLVRPDLVPEVREELSGLVHQTYRLASIIEDLLLLARADAGRLQIAFEPLDLARLLESWMDDIAAVPEWPGLAVEPDFPTELVISGEKRYASIIVQNLLENSRKYNRSGGRIRVSAREAGAWVLLTIGNTGRVIPEANQEHIFERFHRGAVGENVPGHGLGLNLARELARLHGGDLRLVRSAGDWTEFEVRFRNARPAATSLDQAA